MSKPIPHGTSSGYQYHGCRCDECKAHQAEQCRQWRAANVEKKRAWDRQWRAANREKTLESGRRWRAANPGKSTEVVRAWLRENPERAYEINRTRDQRYRARKLAAFIEDVPPLEIFIRDEWQCMVPGCLYPGVPASRDIPCSDPLYASVDHVIPLALGGLHERSNLACAHLHCNKAKGNRTEIITTLLENGSQL